MDPPDNDHTTGNWSSLIGIVTAICGNVLISIALNVQRYAHIRLKEQQEEQKRLLRRAEQRVGKRRAPAPSIRNTGSPANHTDGVRNGRRAAQNGAGRADRVAADSDEDAISSERTPLLASRPSRDRGGLERDGQREQCSPDDVPKKSYVRSPYWWAGIIMMTIGEAGNFLAYGFAPASIVSPLGVVAIISNCIIAPLFMKEPFRKRDFFGVVIAVAGAVTVVLSASDNNPKLGPHEIWGLIATWEFETYLGITTLVIILLMLASEKYGERSIFIDLGLVGLFGGYTALSTKGIASMLSYTLFRAITFPVTYLLGLVLVFTAVMQIIYINRALRRFDATQVIPTQFVLFTLSVILGSAILYRDFEKTPGGDAGKFIGGCFLTFLGVWLITSARERDYDEEEALDTEVASGIALTRGDSYQQDVTDNDGEVPASPIEIREDDFEDEEAAGNKPRYTRPHSEVSLPESLARNHWESSTLPSSGGTPYRLSRQPSLGEASPLTENPWLSNPDLQGKYRTSMQKFFKPFTSIFTGQSKSLSGAQISDSAIHSAPDLPQSLTQQDASLSPPLQLPRHSIPHGDAEGAPPIPHTPPQNGHRASLSTIYPGLFASPLSTSLGTMVADSLRHYTPRRAAQVAQTARSRLLPSAFTPHTPHLRRRGNSEGNSPPHQSPRRRGVGIGSEGGGSEETDGLRDRSSSEPNTPAVGRRRSVGNRLGDFLSMRRGKTEKASDESRSGSGTGQDTPETMEEGNLSHGSNGDGLGGAHGRGEGGDAVSG